MGAHQGGWESGERWEIDGERSNLGFVLRHFVLSEIRGRFQRWGGELVLDSGDINRSTIKVWIDLASIDTGDAERDAQLRSSELLSVDRFPRAEFQSTSVVQATATQALLTGRLSLHGVTQMVEFIVIAQQNRIDPQGLKRAAYRLRGKIDRQVFGLHWNQDLDVGGVVVGDKVDLDAYVEVVRSDEATPGDGDRHAPGPTEAGG